MPSFNFQFELQCDKDQDYCLQNDSTNQKNQNKEIKLEQQNIINFYKSVNTELNGTLIKVLERLLRIYKMMNAPKQKLEAYQRAITVLEEQPTQIVTAQQIDKLQLMGAKIKQYLKELLQTGKLELLQNLENNPEVKSLELFNSIWGVGKMRAQNLFDMGYKNLEGIERDQEKLLTNQQKIGLKYFEEINERMDREEVAKIISVIQEKLKQYPLQIIPVGSFRSINQRGRKTCGDVDLIIIRKDDKQIAGLLGQIISKLTEQNLLTGYFRVQFYAKRT